jgi:GNAT superfamily N-acetyltransferase
LALDQQALDRKSIGLDGCEAVSVRRLTEQDVPAFLDLIDALADYEKLARPEPEARARLGADAVGDRPRIRVFLAERAERVIGYAVYFETYSTFLARPTLFLEDIFVLADERRSGAGSALMKELAQEAIRLGCGRMEWQVLAWNTPAITFYERCQAKRMDEWYTYRLTADQVADLAEGV